MTSIEDIKTMPKSTFKKLVKNEVKKSAFEHLEKEKEKQDKIKDLDISQLEIQDYLCSENVETNKLSKMIFNLLAQTADVKANNPWNYENNLCVCQENEETQKHFYLCSKIDPNIDDKKVEYEQIFVGENEDKLHIAKTFVRKFKWRDELRKKMEETVEKEETYDNGGTDENEEANENDETDDNEETVETDVTSNSEPSALDVVQSTSVEPEWEGEPLT